VRQELSAGLSLKHFKHNSPASFPVSKNEDQTMKIVDDVANVVQDIISSYETRIESVSSIFDATHQLIEGFRDSFLDTKQEREKLNAELRENLAKNESLRKKDFDTMMLGILSAQEKRENEVRDLLKKYLGSQREMAYTLRINLADIKAALTKGEVERVKKFQEMIKEIIVKQEERKNEVTSMLNNFQNYQREMAKKFRELLVKGTQLRIKDLKIMLKTI